MLENHKRLNCRKRSITIHDLDFQRQTLSFEWDKTNGRRILKPCKKYEDFCFKIKGQTFGPTFCLQHATLFPTTSDCVENTQTNLIQFQFFFIKRSHKEFFETFFKSKIHL